MTNLSKLVHTTILVATVLAAGSQAQTNAGSFGSAHIVVKSGSFAFGGRPIADLDALESVVRLVHPKIIYLSACGTEAVPSLKATVQRLNEFPLSIQMLSPGSQDCETVAMATRVNMGSASASESDGHAAVEAYWRQVAP